MNKLKQSLITAVCIVLTTPVCAGSLTLPNTFVSGTPAKAAEVNGNFSAVQAAVNDNNARITANTTNKQNTVVGTCAAGSSIRVVNSDGSVVCEVDNNSGGTITGVTAGAGLTGGGSVGSVTLKLASGAVSVSAMQVLPIYEGQCLAFRGSSYLSWSTSSTNVNCSGRAGIQVPQGATLTGLSCALYDNDATAANSASLAVTSTDGLVNSTIYLTPSTIDSTSPQVVSTTTVYNNTGRVVDNNAYSYYLQWYSGAHNTTTVGTNARFYACRITYTY